MKAALFFIALTLIGAPAFAVELSPVGSGSFGWRDLTLARQDVTAEKTVLTGKTTHLEHLQVLVTTLAPGRASRDIQPHRDFEELVLVKSGLLQVTLDDQVKTLGSGSVALTLPGDVHRYENTGSTSVTYYSMRYRSKAEVDVARGKRAGGSFTVDFKDLQFEPHDRGGKRDYFDRATAMCRNFEMHVTTLNKGIQSHPPHTHLAEEIILMIDGKAEEYIASTTHKIATGDFVFLDSQIPHAIRNISEGDCTYFAFQWR